MPKTTYTKTTSLLFMLLAYGLAIALGILSAGFAPADWPLWAQFALGDTVGTIVIFIFSLIFNNSSLYDPYWSVAPIAMGLVLFYLVVSWLQPDLRMWVTLGLLLFWGIRLTWNFFRGWPDMSHEDWRYLNLRKQTGKAWWLVSFSGIHFFPTVLVFLGFFPLFVVMYPQTNSFGIVDVIAIVVTLGAILIEMIADEQLKKFRLSNPPKDAILETGLWAYSRHPNYFGEMTFWIGMGLFGFAARPEAWWVWAGGLSMVLLFVIVSIPMIEKRMVEKRPGYREVQKRVSMLVPWWRRS